LTHGNKVNDTLLTRVSIDFRVINPANYNHAEAKECRSINTGTRMCVGDHFVVMGNYADDFLRDLKVTA